MEKSKAQQYFESLKTSDKYPTSESIVNAFNAGVASTTPQSVDEFLKEPLNSCLTMALRYLDSDQQKSLANQILDRFKTPQSVEMSLFEMAIEEYNKISEHVDFIYSNDHVSLNESNAYYTGFVNAFELGFKSAQFKAEQLEKENARLKESLGVFEAWNVIHVLEKLADATDFLLKHRDYDRDGWEEVANCVKRGNEYADRITKALQSTETKD